MRVLLKKQLKYKMSRIQGKNTKPEILVRSYLHKLGYRFKLHDKKLPGKPDIVLKKYNAAIFINGCFWHQHSRCRLAKIPKTRTKFWRNKLTENVNRQRKNIKALKKMGYKVITIWECQAYWKLTKTISKIKDRLKISSHIV